MTWTIKDAFNNTSYYQQKVTVVDDAAPIISGMPSNITVYTGAGATGCSQTASWTLPTATDNCAMGTLVSNYQPGAVFQLGATTVTYTATDAGGNQSTASFTVTVVDNTKPVISNVPASIQTCNPNVTWTAPTAADNCGTVVSFSSNAPASFPVGTTTVTYTAIDDAGNTATYSFDVTIFPTPVVLVTSNGPICAGENLSLSAGGGSSYAWTGPNGFSSIQQNPVIYLATPAASGLYQVTVSNIYGCSATSSINVTVNTPAAAIVSANSPVCSGGTLNLQSGWRRVLFMERPEWILFNTTESFDRRHYQCRCRYIYCNSDQCFRLQQPGFYPGQHQPGNQCTGSKQWSCL